VLCECVCRQGVFGNVTSRQIIDKDPRREKTAADETYLQRVGDRVRAARDGLGLTRKSLSVVSGVSERYLADLEAGAGNASLLVLRRIATALHLEMEGLLAAGPDPAPELVTAQKLLRQLPGAELAKVRRLLEQSVGSPARARQHRIALIGLRGAGKSTLGRATADALGVPFIELDREIERVAGMELSEIFALQGKTGYRQHELRCLQAVMHQYERAVIATGGSLVTEPEAYDLLLDSCHVVWLKAAPQSHMDRVVAQGDLRPMADNPRAMDDLRAILDRRKALYARAHAVVDTTETSHEEAVRAILATIDHSAAETDGGATRTV